MAIALLSSCQKSLRPEKYVNRINTDENLVIEQAGENFTYEAMFRPDDFMALLSFGNESINKEHFYAQKKSYGDNINFQFRIHTKDKNREALKAGLLNKADYFQRLNHLSEGVQRDFKILLGSDTLLCQMVHFERTYSMRPYVNLLLSFPCTPKQKKQDFTLLYNDLLFDGTSQKFVYQQSKINQCPKLKL